MKVVGFKTLNNEKKKRKVKILCVSHFFRNSIVIMSVLLFFMVFGLINTTFTITLKDAIKNFIVAMNFRF